MLLEAYVVIVGAGTGTAGCVLAASLSENTDLRVLLLEAGETDRNLWIQGTERNIQNGQQSAPGLVHEERTGPGLKGRRVPFPRGKTFGGTSALNGMTDIRGNPCDYDRWRDLGNGGWEWNDVRPYFRRSEANVRGAGEHHGDSGPLSVSDIGRDKLADAFLHAAAEAGYPLIADFNRPLKEGASYYPMMIRRGRRVCGAGAYLRSAMRQPNLQALTSAQAMRLLFVGRRATGIEFQRGVGIRTAHARPLFTAKFTDPQDYLCHAEAGLIQQFVVTAYPTKAIGNAHS